MTVPAPLSGFGGIAVEPGTIPSRIASGGGFGDFCGAGIMAWFVGVFSFGAGGGLQFSAHF